jgi:hypothetical protein
MPKRCGPAWAGAAGRPGDDVVRQRPDITSPCSSQASSQARHDRAARAIVHLMREVEALRDENGRLRIALRRYHIEPQSTFPMLSGAEIVSILHSGDDRSAQSAARSDLAKLAANDAVTVWENCSLATEDVVARQRYAEAALRSAVERIARADVGTLSRTLNIEAFGLVRFAAAGTLDGQRIADALAAAGISAGISAQQVMATLQDAFCARGAI